MSYTPVPIVTSPSDLAKTSKPQEKGLVEPPAKPVKPMLEVTAIPEKDSENSSPKPTAQTLGGELADGMINLPTQIDTDYVPSPALAQHPGVYKCVVLCCIT